MLRNANEGEEFVFVDFVFGFLEETFAAQSPANHPADQTHYHRTLNDRG